MRIEGQCTPGSTADAGRPTLPAGEDWSAKFVLGVDHHEVPVPMARMTENVLDWEHLPWVHSENFLSSELLGHGPGWYRARFGNATGTFNDVLVVLHENRPADSRWSIILEEGPQAGHVVYTRARTVSEGHIETDVTFYAPSAPRNPVMQKAMFESFKRQYAMLYVQDIEMMSERNLAIERLAARESDVAPGGSLGLVDEVIGRTPFVITLHGQRFWVRHVDGELSAFGADCPHQLGPLPCPSHGSGKGEISSEQVVCPWHGYSFDARTGRSTDGRALRLARPPRLVVQGGEVRVEAASARTAVE